MPEEIPPPGQTPANYQRTTGGSHLRWQPPSPERLQEMLPAYEIVSILGQGGMGAVYKGKQKSLDREVAIKILPPEAGDEDMQFVERFKNEARTMAKMNHPAIVQVYDFGETLEGQLYIVMEYIDGTDVAKMIQSQGKLPEDYALSISAHVCDALQYAHTRGTVHRDIKPANILINMEGQVKVADFGLAKATDPTQMGLTKTNFAMGTPDFVSPEALMPGVPLDGRADLYAVGVMLYNMLTGTIPRGAFRMPSFTLKTDERFDKIITKAMEMDRELRYQTALDLRRDLDVILTTPAAKAGGQTLPAQAALPQKPMGKSPSAPGQKPVTKTPPPAKQAAKPPATVTAAPAPKSNAVMIYSIAAAIVVSAGAFFMFSGGGKKPAAAPKTVAEAKPTPWEPETKSKAPTPKPSSRPAETKPEPKPKSSSSSPSSPKLTPPPAAPVVAADGLPWVDGRAQWFGGTKTNEGFSRKPGEAVRAARFASMRPLPDSALPMRDMVVRATVRFDSAEDNAHALISVRSVGAASYTLKIEPGMQAVRLMPYTSGKASPVFAEYRLPADFDIKKPHALELRVVGDLLTAMLDGRKILEHRDTQLTAGHPALGAQKAWIESFEYANLDSTGAVPVATAPATPAKSASIPPGWTDLLATADVARDALRGQWSMTPAGLHCANGGEMQFFQLNYTPPEEYDFQIDFSRMGKVSKSDLGSVSQLLVVPGHRFALHMGSFGSVLGALLDGIRWNDPKRVEGISREAKTGSDVRMIARVEVRRGKVRVWVDDKEVVNWSGDFKRLQLHTPNYDKRDETRLAVACQNDEVVFHSIMVRAAGAESAQPTRDLPAPASSLTAPVDLLALVDVKRDAVAGKWEKTPEGVTLMPESADRFLLFDY
ncbi:MAG: protein kinase, partial [Prosthecobacter sp.]